MQRATEVSAEGRRRERATAAAGDSSRKDNKAEGVSCERSLRNRSHRSPRQIHTVHNHTTAILKQSPLPPPPPTPPPPSSPHQQQHPHHPARDCKPTKSELSTRVPQARRLGPLSCSSRPPLHCNPLVSVNSGLQNHSVYGFSWLCCIVAGFPSARPRETEVEAKQTKHTPSPEL